MLAWLRVATGGTRLNSYPSVHQLSDLHLHPGGKSHSDAKMLKVLVQRGPIPHAEFAHAAGVHVAIHRSSGGVNFGHMLGDEVITIFRALELWDLTARPLHVYLNDVNKTTKLYSLLNLEKPPLPLDTIHLPRARCFERFVVGWDQLIGFMPREFVTNPRLRPTGIC